MTAGRYSRDKYVASRIARGLPERAVRGRKRVEAVPHAHDPGVTAWWWVRQAFWCFAFGFAIMLVPIISGWGWATVYLSALAAP